MSVFRLHANILPKTMSSSFTTCPSISSMKKWLKERIPPPIMVYLLSASNGVHNAIKWWAQCFHGKWAIDSALVGGIKKHSIESEKIVGFLGSMCRMTSGAYTEKKNTRYYTPPSLHRVNVLGWEGAGKSQHSHYPWHTGVQLLFFSSFLLLQYRLFTDNNTSIGNC